MYDLLPDLPNLRLDARPSVPSHLDNQLARVLGVLAAAERALDDGPCDNKSAREEEGKGGMGLISETSRRVSQSRNGCRKGMLNSERRTLDDLDRLAEEEERLLPVRRGACGARGKEDLGGVEALGAVRGGSETAVRGEEVIKVAEEGVDLGRTPLSTVGW